MHDSLLSPEEIVPGLARLAGRPAAAGVGPLEGYPQWYACQKFLQTKFLG